MALLVMLRHGLSVWNRENRFTGWTDVPLSEEGIQQTKEAAKLLNSYRFDMAYTSVLQRAIHTLDILLNEINHPKIPIIKSEKLNERHYGKLQGLNKDEIRQKYGEEQFLLWRRSFATRPPEGESLEDTAKRTLPFFYSNIVPELDRGKNILVSAHGNSMRSIVMDLDRMAPDAVAKLEIGYCVPMVYERTNEEFRKIG